MANRLTHVSLFLLLLSSSSLFAADRKWVLIGPPSPSIESIVPDRKNPDVWFLLTVTDKDQRTGRVYRSVDKGQNWTATSLVRAIQVLVHPETSHVFVHTLNRKTGGGKLWESSNQGKTFRIFNQVDFPIRILRIFYCNDQGHL